MRTGSYTPRTDNYHAYMRGWDGLNVRETAPGELTGPLGPLVIYCLRMLDAPIGPIDYERLEWEYYKQRAGLVPSVDPRYLTVRLKPFRAWVLHNIGRITMGPRQEARYEKQRRWNFQRAVMRDYAIHGPHFHNPDHRASWERASGW